MEDELRGAHRTAKSRAKVLTATQTLLVGDGDFGDEGIKSLLVHLPEVHTETLEELVSCVLHVMLIVGVVDDAL